MRRLYLVLLLSCLGPVLALLLAYDLRAFSFLPPGLAFGVAIQTLRRELAALRFKRLEQAWWEFLAAWQSARGGAEATEAEPEPGVWEVDPPPAPRFLEFLGLDATATVKDVKRAFRQRVRAVHPDTGGSHRGFVELRQAYEQALAWIERQQGRAQA